MTSTKITQVKKSKLATKMAAAAAAGAFMISQEASAQTTVGDAVSLASLNGFSNAIVQPDGSLLVELANGQTFVVPAGDFVQANGQFLVDQNVLEGLIGADGPNLALLGLGAAVVAGVGIALSSGGDDDVEIAPPVAEDVPAGPTAGDDVLTGTDGDDTIDGLGGDDDISGLAGNDTLIGGAGNDTLSGDAGDDLLVGGGGTDVIDGGEGNDTNSFEGIGSGVTASVAADGTGTADYGMVNESFTGIENLTGTDNDDILIATGAAANTLIGGAGDDFISGGGGADITDGGDGIDTVSFADIGSEVSVSVDETGTGTAQYLAPSGAEIVDTVANFEIFEGREGDGDTIDVSSFGTGVRIDLDTNTPNPGPATQDGVVEVDGETVLTLVDFENIVGTDFDDTLLGNNDFNIIDGGAGDDAIHSFGGADVLDGGEGVDTLLLTATPAGTVVTLDETGSGTVQINGADADVFSNFENVSGSNTGDDVITGNQVDNVLNGNGGDDVLSGLGGADTINGGDGDDLIAGGGGTDILDGGDGIDTNSFVGIGGDVTASLAAGTASYGMVNETFVNFENLTGSVGDDNLTGDAGANVLDGAEGDDTLTGGGGTDIIDGGAGIDTNSFAGIGLGVTATLAADGTGIADYGMVNETFTGIENLTGSDNDDVLIATGAAANTIFGGDGDDIIAGGGGTDILDGGDGIDTNSFVGIGGNVTASLAAGTASYGMVNETFVNFENLTGSVGDDNLTGDAGANVLEGAAGDDTLSGGAGNDTLDGGVGFDTVTFLDVADNITVTSNGDGTFTASSALDGVNTLSNIESLIDSTGAVIDFPANVLADGSSDISGSGAAPTQFTLVEGSNTISNTVVNAQGTGTETIRDVDIFTVLVPEGFTLSEVNITNFDSADNVGFAAVIEGNSFPVDFASNGLDSSGFLGIALFGDNNDLLQDLSEGLGTNPIIGFDPAEGLVGGVGGTSYTFLVQQNGDNVIDFTFDFVLTETASNAAVSSATSTVKLEDGFSSNEVEFDFIADDANVSNEAQFEFEQVEDFDFATFDALSDVFEVA